MTEIGGNFNKKCDIILIDYKLQQHLSALFHDYFL